MDAMVRCLVFSISLHMGLLAVTLSLASGKVKFVPPVIIDLTLNSSPVSELNTKEKTEQRISSPRPTVASPPAPPMRRKLEKRQPQAQHHVQQAQSQVQVASSGSINTVPAPVALGQTNAITEASRQGDAVSAFPAVASSRGSQAGKNQAVTPEKAQQRYVKEQFTYIRDKIIKSLTYPQMAQRMGWSGRVSVSFVVAEDGGVHSLKVRESSGYVVLDTCAMETVKRCAPFRIPPVAVEIVMPVSFKLQ